MHIVETGALSTWQSGDVIGNGRFLYRYNCIAVYLLNIRHYVRLTCKNKRQLSYLLSYPSRQLRASAALANISFWLMSFDT